MVQVEVDHYTGNIISPSVFVIRKVFIKVSIKGDVGGIKHGYIIQIQ